MKCSICYGDVDEQKLPNGEVYWSEGHNAWPVNDGRCCTRCNDSVVIRARINQMGQQVQGNGHGTSK
jgi:hypothetical protein